jgi:hypothetical protein
MSKSRVARFILSASFILSACVEPQGAAAPVESTVEAGAPLGVVIDLARARRWELGWSSVSAYDLATGRRIRTVPLPRMISSAAAASCLPEMILARSGALIVASNIQPVLWRVSPSRFEVERIEIQLDTDTDQDIGFTRLAWSAGESALHAVSAPTGTLWRIDVAGGKGEKMGQAEALRGKCGPPQPPL